MLSHSDTAAVRSMLTIRPSKLAVLIVYTGIAQLAGTIGLLASMAH